MNNIKYKKLIIINTFHLLFLSVLLFFSFSYRVELERLFHPKSISAQTLEQCQSKIQQRFGINMVGFSYEEMQWAFAKFVEIEDTKLLDYVKGTSVIKSGSSYQNGCRTINLRDYRPDRTLFNVMLIHELGHIIRNCNDRSTVYWNDHLNALNSEGGVTAYAETSGCGGSDRQSEDYAEMVAYYLNPLASSMAATCAPKTANPYANEKHPLHFEVAKKLLGTFP